MCEVSNLFGGRIFFEHDRFEFVVPKLLSIAIRSPKNWLCFMTVNPNRHLEIHMSDMLLKSIICGRDK